MRTQRSDVLPSPAPPATADLDEPPTTRPESGESQLFSPLKYMPMRAWPWP